MVQGLELTTSYNPFLDNFCAEFAYHGWVNVEAPSSNKATIK